jgi:hypothetical protein
MTRTLFIPNDPPYGTERSYNALRLAGSRARRPGEEVKVFLMGDAASCAKSGQKVWAWPASSRLRISTSGGHACSGYGTNSGSGGSAGPWPGPQR